MNCRVGRKYFPANIDFIKLLIDKPYVGLQEPIDITHKLEIDREVQLHKAYLWGKIPFQLYVKMLDTRREYNIPEDSHFSHFTPTLIPLNE